MDDMILRVSNLVKKYDNFSLKNVSFNVPKGYIMGFIGQNGAGKSTTIKAIMNLIDFDGGSIEIFGLDNRKHCNEIRNRIGYVSEEQYFYEDMTVEWTGKFIGSFYSKWDEGYFRKLLEQFSLDSRKKIKELSKGMKTKLSLALALGHRPELLILDEPTSGLDPVVRSEFLEIFLEIVQDDSCSIFFSSHITTDIEKVADYVTIIDNGRIILSEEEVGVGIVSFFIIILFFIILVSIYLPLAYKLGYIKANSINRFFLIGIFAVSTAAGLVLENISGSSPPAFISRISEFLSSVNPYTMLILAIAFTVAIYFISMELSIKFFKKRNLF
ncbi:MAG TPA: ATP-binding cassette domain-containing protein [Clostridiaceae bacterium]|nr:ATP-binding cassette domain-containing protein [Clostridiaceae bacterium]